MKKKAFSLLELILVMAVIAFIALLGLWGLLSFKAETELQNGIADILTTLRTLQNQARNSTRIGTQTTTVYDLYGFLLINGSYSTYYCNYTNSFKTDAICTEINQQLFSISSSLNIQMTGCEQEGVFFERLSGNIVFLKSAGGNYQVSASGTCRINITHYLISTTNGVNINSSKNLITRD